MAEPLTLNDGIDDNRSQERTVSVQLHCGCSDHFTPLPGNDHRRHMLVNAVEGKVLCLEQSADRRQIAFFRCVNHHTGLRLGERSMPHLSGCS